MVSSTEQTPTSSETDATLDRWQSEEYKYGFYTDIETDTLPPGLSEDVVRLISAKKDEPDWLLQWRLKAYRHWLTMTEPTWQNVHYEPIDYQKIIYYSAPKQAKDRPQSLDDVDPKLLETYEKLGIPLQERAILAGVAVDAVFDSVSVATPSRRSSARSASSSARSPKPCMIIRSWCSNTSDPSSRITTTSSLR